ncbi:MAG: nicotinate (nicotinamide) nucleotide adenylyltransferase [Planctomycetes bacterium]|nr:nicotinate (nicotinamide) nucleotide adenylyltransferase [Planctomycetota bacterium]
MRRLLYGGTFDPVHAGHIAIALAAGRATGAERVSLVPASVSPHKLATVASAEDRLAMCRLAAAEHPTIDVLDIEVRRGGRSYTFDTISELLAGPFRGDQVMLLLGQDALIDLPKWHRARELAALVPIAVAPRPGAAAPDWDALTAAIGAEAVTGIRGRVLRLPTSPVSATAVRERRAQGRSIRCWVPDAVADYIEANGLYVVPSR